MSNLILHPKTYAQIQRLADNPAHAILLTGAAGSGKTALAQKLTADILNLSTEQMRTYSYFRTIQPDEQGTLSIDTVRQLQNFLRLKTTGASPIRRICIIEHADSLTFEAQNALLKLLEEPPADTVLMLTADSPANLLPTIASRTAELRVHPPLAAELVRYFEQYYSAEQVRQAFYLSGGLPGLMHALVYDESHPLKASIAQAKDLLRRTKFERLGEVDVLSKQKTEANSLVQAFVRLARAGLHQAAQKGDGAAAKRWQELRRQALNTAEALNQNVNAKLALTNFMLQI